MFLIRRLICAVFLAPFWVVDCESTGIRCAICLLTHCDGNSEHLVCLVATRFKVEVYDPAQLQIEFSQYTYLLLFKQKVIWFGHETCIDVVLIG